MALGNAILAALLEGEASGYDLAKVFDTSVANFWAATPQQLYRELDRLEDNGLVQARVVQQLRRPNKRLFRLTDAGREALREFTGAAPRPTAIRDELLVKVQAVDAGDQESVLAFVEAKRAAARDKLATYERLRDHMLAGQPEQDYLRTAQRIGPYLTLLRGIAFERENLRWSQRVIATLRGRQT